MVTKGRKENRDRTGSFSGVTKPDDIRSGIGGVHQTLGRLLGWCGKCAAEQHRTH